MNFCTKCGAKLQEGNAFCTKCGASVVENAKESSTSGIDVMVTEVAPAPAPGVSEQRTAVMNVAGAGGTQQMPAQYAAENYVAPASQPEKPKSKKGFIIGIIAAIVVVAVAVIVVLVVMQEDEPAPSAAPVQNQVQTTTNQDSATSSTDSSAANSTATQSSTQKEYILPTSNSAYITAADLTALSDFELYVARNEIFARYGRGFKNADLAEWFSKQPWYTQRYTPEQFEAMESPLNKYEKENVNVIMAEEKRRNSSYLS